MKSHVIPSRGWVPRPYNTPPRYGTFNLQAIGKAIAEIQAGMVHKYFFLPTKCSRLRPAIAHSSVAHKNAWIKRKDDLCSHPSFGVARHSVTNAVCLWAPPLVFRDRQDGQGLSNEALFFYFRSFDLVFVHILFLRSNGVVRGSV